MYKIGIYNKLIDNIELLNGCNRIFEINDFDRLKSFIREEDTLITCSTFTLYGIELLELLEIKENFNLTIKCVSDINIDTSTPTGNMCFQTNMIILETIKGNSEIIKKILNF